MKNLKFLLLSFGLTLIPAFASADFRNNYYQKQHWGSSYRNNYHSDGYNRRGFGNYQYRDSNRYSDSAIWNGVKSGRLTKNEARELRQDEFQIQRKEAAYRSDGVLTKKERNDLKDERKDFYKDLNHELNDGERRW